jgi:hypothetical protein
MCGATFVASVIVISTLVSGSSDIEAKASIVAPGNFERGFPAEAASLSVDCRQQTWPYIESSCLRQQTPGREVRFVTNRQPHTQPR